MAQPSPHIRFRKKMRLLCDALERLGFDVETTSQALEDTHLRSSRKLYPGLTYRMELVSKSSPDGVILSGPSGRSWCWVEADSESSDDPSTKAATEVATHQGGPQAPPRGPLLNWTIGYGDELVVPFTEPPHEQEEELFTKLVKLIGTRLRQAQTELKPKDAAKPSWLLAPHPQPLDRQLPEGLPVLGLSKNVKREGNIEAFVPEASEDSESAYVLASSTGDHTFWADEVFLK